MVVENEPILNSLTIYETRPGTNRIDVKFRERR
jgi:hypothetical protein